MQWSVFLILSALSLVCSVIWAIARTNAKYKSGRLLEPSRILFLGVILSSFILSFPIYNNTFKLSECGLFETIIMSVLNMIKLFLVDGDFDFIRANLMDAPASVVKGYTVLFSILFVLAPVLTFGFVISFFKNLSAHKQYITHFFWDVFIFSELNEKSVALARSLYDNKQKGRFFVFTDVFETEEKQHSELIEKAKEIGAVCFKKDINAIDFTFHSKKRKMNFFTIGLDQNKNISQALEIVNKLKNRENTNLYVFTTQVESELLLTKAFNSAQNDIKIKVRRVNEVQSLIMRNLYENGYEKVFKSAFDDQSGIKKINAVIVGMGQHGTEMAKALCWLCQMDGYLVQINTYDLDKHAEEKFASKCPELMEFSGKLNIEGETRYTINIHSDVDVDSASFDQMVKDLPKTTYVFVALGDDEKNISTAIKLRTLLAQKGYAPEIQAVVYNSEKKEALENITNYKGQEYNIDFIGDVRSSYSEEVILNSDVEKTALERHLKWGKESEFWQYNYNYRSSVASAIGRKIKQLCGIPGIDKIPEERTETQLQAIRILEHRRWNAYMRTEGYVYGGTVDKTGRNDLAKTHNCLVPFAELPLSEQEKDDD